MDPFQSWLEQVSTASSRMVHVADQLMATWSTDQMVQYSMWVSAS